MGTETQLVKVEHLYKEFDENTKVLEDINLTINKNEVIAILGPSGTGKSTLLRCLNYLTVPTKGKITIGDVTVDAQNHTKKDVIELQGKVAENFENLKSMSIDLNNYFNDFYAKNCDLSDEMKEKKMINHDYWIDILQGMQEVNSKYWDYEFIY